MENTELAPSCDFLCVHEDTVKAVLAQLPAEAELAGLAELFRVFGEPTRIKILFVLFEAELCVCDIAQLLGASQSAVSHQLRILKAGRLVKYRREGKTVFYSLDDEHVHSLLALGLSHLRELHGG